MSISTVKIGTLDISRFVLGGNPFSGFSHQSKTQDDRFRTWYTPERIVETLFHAESLGVQTVLARGDAHITACLAEYWRQGGTLKWVAQTASEMASALIGAQYCHDHGASACYVHGGVVDYLVAQQRYDELASAIEFVSGAGLPAGIAGHMPDDFMWAEENLNCDFYMVCYYNPSPRSDSPHHVHGIAEVFSEEDRADRVAIIPKLTKPVIHYKILAAGRLAPEDAFAFAGKNLRPQDAVCVGVNTGDDPEMLIKDIELYEKFMGS